MTLTHTTSHHCFIGLPHHHINSMTSCHNHSSIPLCHPLHFHPIGVITSVNLSVNDNHSIVPTIVNTTEMYICTIYLQMYVYMYGVMYVLIYHIYLYM